MCRLQAVIVNIVDVSYGGENGFNQVRVALLGHTVACEYTQASALTCEQSDQAIELSTDILANVKFIQEKKLIAKYGLLIFGLFHGKPLSSAAYAQVL